VQRRCVLHRKQAPSKQGIRKLLDESGLCCAVLENLAAAAGAVLVLGS
jgi:DNA-binding FrmR family transcriptional regulator